MGFERVVTRTLPDGLSARYFPFHISLEGLESNLLCRDDEDYDVVEKYIFISALEWGVDVVIHVVMSNHAHVSVLAASLEAAFDHDQAFFLKTIGSVNPDEMKQKLITNLRAWRPDSEFLLTVNDLAGRWFQKTPSELTPEQKIRLVPYIYRCYRTSVPQLARCMRMKREDVERLTQKPRRENAERRAEGGADGMMVTQAGRW